MNSTTTILVLGSVNQDAFMRLQAIPRPGETVTGGQISHALGGKGANAAVAALRAGGQVSFACAVGEDAVGRDAIETLRRTGLNLDLAWVCPDAATGTAFILLDAHGQNAIAVAPGANFAWDEPRTESLRQAIMDAGMLILGNEISPGATVRALALAREAGTQVLLNYAPVAAQEVPLNSAVTTLVVNESEAAALAESDVDDVSGANRAVEILLERGPIRVALTLGALGVVLGDATGIRHLPAFKCVAVDTVAAGDTFCGALAVALGEGRSFDEAARFASAAAALCVTRAGALPSIPHRNEIEALQHP